MDGRLGPFMAVHSWKIICFPKRDAAAQTVALPRFEHLVNSASALPALATEIFISGSFYHEYSFHIFHIEN